MVDTAASGTADATATDAVDVRWMLLFADVPRPHAGREIEYWSTITATTPGEGTGDRGQFVPLRPAHGEAVVWVQTVGRDVGGWHLDLYPSDRARAVATAVALGARVVREDTWFTVLSSPTGLPFCLVGGVTDPDVPPAPSWPGGYRSEVDQLSIDIPALAFDLEADFWSALTGWERRHGDHPEFDHLVRPDDMPVRLLLQRLGPDDVGGIRAHADLAADDRAAETQRHVAAGGEIVTVETGWTVLRDPGGLLYCITDRTPRG